MMTSPVRAIGLLGSLFLCVAAGVLAAQPEGGRFESLGIPVRVGGLMGCIVGPNGRGGEALYFYFKQISGLLFLVQVASDPGEGLQFNAPQGPGGWGPPAGPAGKIYRGTWGAAHILRID